MTSPVRGLHHITAISGDPQRNLDFYRRVLGLRFVKRTVNFDDPGTYHLYYGDRVGAPGTALTFFPWQGIPRGRAGSGEASTTLFAVPPGSLAYWQARLASHGVAHEHPIERFGTRRLIAEDGDGTRFALVEHADPRAPWTGEGLDAAHAIRGFYGIELTLTEQAATVGLLTEHMGYEETAREGSVTRLVSTSAASAQVVEIDERPGLAAARQGTGRVHHVAFAVADDAAHATIRQELLRAGYQVTPVIDRDYFHAIYFRSPGGVLFEIATNQPGFTVDEPEASLGQALKLPKQHEHLRARLEQHLPPLAA